MNSIDPTFKSIQTLPYINIQQSDRLVANEVFEAEMPKYLQFSTLGKIKRAAYNIFSVVFFPLGVCRLIKQKLHSAGSSMVLPSQNHPKNTDSIKKGKEYLQQKLDGTGVTIRTPDGILLDGMHFPGKKEGVNLNTSDQTIIFFNGNGENYESAGSPLKGIVTKKVINEDGQETDVQVAISYVNCNFKDFTKMGYNVFVFNYRGVQNSSGTPTREGLILDGEAALQYVNKGLKVPMDRITLFGHSLGGAISAQVAANNPEVNVCNDRSFSSLSKVAHVTFSEVHPLIGALASAAIRILGWNFDTVKAWKKIEGKKWVIYNSNDLTIKPKGSLYKGLKNTHQVAQVIKLEDTAFYNYLQRKVNKKQELLNEQEAIPLIKDLLDKNKVEWNQASAHNRKLVRRDAKAQT